MNTVPSQFAVPAPLYGPFAPTSVSIPRAFVQRNACDFTLLSETAPKTVLPSALTPPTPATPGESAGPGVPMRSKMGVAVGATCPHVGFGPASGPLGPPSWLVASTAKMLMCDTEQVS